MIQTSTKNLRAHLNDFLHKVQAGETVQVCEHDVPFATILPVPAGKRNRTSLGCGRGSLQIKGDVIAPAMEAKDWDMCGGDSERPA